MTLGLAEIAWLRWESGLVVLEERRVGFVRLPDEQDGSLSESLLEAVSCGCTSCENTEELEVLHNKIISVLVGASCEEPSLFLFLFLLLFGSSEEGQ